MPSTLHAPFTLRGVTMRNRIGVSPMCEYSSDDGFANDWHLVHLGSRAVGGAGLVLTEATAVTADGRISPFDLGIYRDEHVEMLARIARFVTAQGAVPGMQISPTPAARRAATRPGAAAGPSPRPTGAGVRHGRRARSRSAIARRRRRRSTARGSGASSPPFAMPRGARSMPDSRCSSSTARTATCCTSSSPRSATTAPTTTAGSFDNRVRLFVEVTEAVRSVWPESLPLLVRISGTDWVEGGWDIEQSIALARILAPLGVDLIDCSSGGIVPGVKIPVGPGYQVEIARRIRRDAGIATAAVGLITDPAQADAIVRDGQADMVFLARQLLRDPYWPLHAAKSLGASVVWPVQYQRAVD